MVEQIRRFLTAPVFEDDEDKTRRAGLLGAILLVVLASGVVGGILVGALSPTGGLSPAGGLSPTGGLSGPAFGGLMAALALGLWFVMRSGRVQLAGVLLSIVLWGATTWQMVSGGGGLRAPTGTGYFVCIGVAGLLLGARAVIVFASLSLLSMSGLFYAEASGLVSVSLPASAGVTDLITLILMLGLTALLLHAAVQSTAQAFERARRDERELSARHRELGEIRASLEQRIADRTRGLQTATEVSRVVVSILDLDELLAAVVNLIQERFKLYYVGLFLVDEIGEWTRDVEGRVQPGRWVVLRAGTGEAGRQMVERVHRFEVGAPMSMIGRCVGEGDAKIVLDVGLESRRFSNPLLPETRSEMALPMRSRGRVIGALTVQSVEGNAFSEDDVAVMQSMVDQIGGAIDNARSFAAAREALDRSETVVQRYVQETWDRFIESGQSITGYRYAGQRSGPSNDAWLPTMGDAVERRQPVVREHTDGPGGSSLAIPLLSGGELIGTVGLRRSGEEPWSEEQIALAQDIGVQVSQTIETRRLFEETQRGARREVVLRQTTERVRSQANLDALLKAAAQEIQRAIGATHVAIRLGTQNKLTPADKGGIQDE